MFKVVTSSSLQICPALNHASLVSINTLLETIPGEHSNDAEVSTVLFTLEWVSTCHIFAFYPLVRTEVDSYIGIDYSLLSDPVVTSRSLDMDFRVSVSLTKADTSAFTTIQVTFFVFYSLLLPPTL